MSEPPIKTQDVAVMFGVSVDTVKKWAEAGKLPHFKTPSGHRRYRRADIEELIEAQTMGDAPTPTQAGAA